VTRIVPGDMLVFVQSASMWSVPLGSTQGENSILSYFLPGDTALVIATYDSFGRSHPLAAGRTETNSLVVCTKTSAIGWVDFLHRKVRILTADDTGTTPA